MKRVFKLASIISLILVLFASCTEVVISSIPSVSSVKRGCTMGLEFFINSHINQYNRNVKSVSKSEALKNFDKFAQDLEDEIELKQYEIFGNTHVTLSLSWYDEIIEVKRLDLQQNVKDTVMLGVIVTFQDVTGNKDAFYNEYTKKIEEAGLLQTKENEYVFYQEFATYQEANEKWETMNKEKIFNLAYLKTYFSKLNGNGFNYGSKLNIHYMVIDGKEAPKDCVVSSSNNPDLTYSITIADNYRSCDGFVMVNITE